MDEASAFVPGHISGFFQVHEPSSDSDQIGSRNCGLCIDAGVSTNLEIEHADANDLEILIDGQKKPAETTRAAANEILESLDRNLSIRIEHSVQAPIGAGYGMSGAGALGTVLTLSQALDLELDSSDILTKAHRAEIKCRSGLGDVGAQVQGGIVIGLKPGAPPHGRWDSINVDRDLEVICGTFAPISTSNLLNNSDFKKKSKKLGEKAMSDLLSDKNLGNFMKISRNFAIDLDFFDNDFERIINEISTHNPLGASAVMLGRAIFAPVSSSEADKLKEKFLNYFDPAEILTTSIDFEGARILS